ncbi:MAG TPA: hypothetical protein VEO94_03710 [Candidatus Dormibacteraeota bacterium]|nr:hypothetical protein [Candidatus Dormibacteraeota bacterium]
MVTGFNTDVQHGGKTYHVQTEDKGLQNPIIETLIYVGGEILAVRRTSYADLLSKGVGQKEISERIETQHNRMIVDIREGRYDGGKVRPFGEGIISSKSFDEVVLDWLRSQATTERIELHMIGSDGFVEGARARLELFVSRVSTGEGIAGAKVKVRLISTVDKPRTLVEGRTDAAGQVSLSCALPVLEGGTAALIIQASIGKESGEIKQLIKKPARKAAS